MKVPTPTCPGNVLADSLSTGTILLAISTGHCRALWACRAITHTSVLYFLVNQPEYDDLSPGTRHDAILAFCGWFLASISALDWATSALANSEAAVLMLGALDAFYSYYDRRMGAGYRVS